jgi:hypothetical protein
LSVSHLRLALEHYSKFFLPNVEKNHLRCSHLFTSSLCLWSTTLKLRITLEETLF